MNTRRRDLLAAGAALVSSAGLAGCAGLLGDDASAVEADETGNRTDAAGGGAAVAPVGPTTAVAAEWNAMRARAWDAVSLGLAGAPGAGASVVQDTFARFENAGGEYGAHEALERTNETNYASFEEALGELRTAGLAAGDLERAREEATIADQHLREAQQSLVEEPTAHALDLQLLGVTAQNAAALASAGAVEAAGAVGDLVLERFENGPAHDALESADGAAYEQFEAGLEGVVSAAGNGDAAGVEAGADEAYAAALEGSYALADAAAAAGAGHVAALQARGWDAAAVAAMGGPSTAYAHAAGLTIYRARVHDAHWLAAVGETARAATVVEDVFAHFEGARAHEALEDADHEAYEGFEAGLSDLQSAIEAGEAGAMDDALGAVDSTLVTGIDALAGSNAPLLESAFFRARIADAHERYRRGEGDVAAGIAEGLFARFEENELDFHESVEETSEDLYHAFEEEHLAGIADAFENGDDEAVATHSEGIQSTLLDFATQVGGTAAVSGAEGAFVAARGFDAAVLDALGADGRAQTIGQGVFEHFEGGSGGYHEALEAADHDRYEAFEADLGALSTAAGDGNDVYGPAKTFNASALASVYAIVSSGGGGATGGAAGTVAQATFADFEAARVHDLLEAADHTAYETFERQLEGLVTAGQEGGNVGDAAGTYADACLWAQFALVDSVEELPVGLQLPGAEGGGGGGGGGGHGGGGEGSDLLGGPNVVEGVPDDANHVVDMTAVAFEPGEVTVSAGDTVAWAFAGGEPHTVTAYEGEIPDGAAYWASGGFESESAAVEGWEHSEGAVAGGQVYVHTFETAGTHEYYCIPHEAAGMVGTIVVE